MENENAGSAPNESGSTENVNNEESKTVEALDNAPKGYKDDFFKQKAKLKETESEKQELLAKLNQYEEAENARLGNHQKIIDTLKEENAKLNGQIEQGEKLKQYESFKSQLTAKASELGFTKPDRILNFISDKDQELLIMGDDNKVDEYGLNKAFENVKSEWGELFKVKNVKIADGNPTTNLNEKPQKTVREMTSAERIALALKLSRQ